MARGTSREGRVSWQNDLSPDHDDYRSSNGDARDMNSSRMGGYETFSIGFVMIAVAICVLVSWSLDDWGLFIPLLMIIVGVFYIALGATIRVKDQTRRSAFADMPFYVFWGGTLGLLGSMWLLNREFPGNLPVIVAVFIVWVGFVVIFLSVRRTHAPRA